MTTQDTSVCPHCGQLDTIRKVTSIVTEGTSVSEYETTAPVHWQGKTYFLPTKRQMTSSTVLAQKLMPPEKPNDPSKPSCSEQFWWGLALCTVFSITVVVLQGVLGGQGNHPISTIAALIGGVTLALWAGWIFSKRQREKQQHYDGVELPRWERAAARWTQLYYCARDDGVFIPGQGQLVPVDRVASFLYGE